MTDRAIQHSALRSVGHKHFFVVAGLFFLSGMTGLILQVVWMYRLGLIFGNAAQATAATLAAFFLGLALGGWFLGNASAKSRRPLRLYGLIETGIALSALLWIPGLEFYRVNYAVVVDLLGGNSGLLTVAKFIFSTSLLLIPTILMGGTFPVLAQYVGKRRRELEIRGTLLYALNTVGASLGTLAAGFFLLAEYGMSTTYFLAVGLATVIGVTAILLDRLSNDDSLPEQETKDSGPIVYQEKPAATAASSRLSYRIMMVFAFASGLLALSAETLWIRMFAQVLQNSVYSFSAVLGVFLIALGAGGFLAHLLVRAAFRPIRVLFLLLIGGGIALGFSSLIFDTITGGLGYIAAEATWTAYVQSVFGLSALVVFPPAVVIGAVFPYLLKASPELHEQPGRFVGKLVLSNALGSTIGPIFVGFIALDTLGLWTSIKWVVVTYGLLALWLSTSVALVKGRWGTVMSAVTIATIILLPSPQSVHLEPDENLVKTWQASDGVVSVVQSKAKDNIQMRLDNYYVLGDTRSVVVEQMQAHIPLLIHPEPEQTLFLGMGTGITAGASLEHDVERVVAVELVPNVIRAAKRYFSPWTNGLFKDPRAEIVAGDARNYLLGTTDRYDVIVGDLFTPWHAGTGSLYTLEQFQLVKEHLQPGGLFAQWLPLYQLTPQSFNTIAATFAAVFPRVTLWRADFSVSRPSIALVGQGKEAKLNEQTLQKNISNVVGSKGDTTNNHMAGLFYLGNLQAIQDRLSDVELNTDDKRTIEFQAPVLSQQANAGKGTYLVGDELERLLTSLSVELPPEQDPYLSDLPKKEIRYVEVGLQYYCYLQLQKAGKPAKADSVRRNIQELAPEFLNNSRQPKNNTN